MFMKWDELVVNGTTPAIKNHTATLINTNQLLVFGGYDGRRNNNSIHLFDTDSGTWSIATNVQGKIPPGRNGHTATLAENKLYIIGGWLGSGPLAASDMHVLDLTTMTWEEPPVIGNPAGPCNMHTANYIEHRREIFVFRGGDGREYLNDLHALNIDTLIWHEVFTEGVAPAPRANHSSTVVEKNLLVFGGWDGTKRLNDVHVLNTETLVWSLAQISGNLPHPRAGMTFTYLNNRIYLFGGSGPSAKCYNDLQVFAPDEMLWLETVTCDTEDAPTVQLSHGEANPNETTAHNQVIVLGNGPGRRAGHSCTVVNRKLFIFGGSYGSEYLDDFFVLDTDPQPQARVNLTSSTEILQKSLQQFLNTGEFSDISFLVEGRVVYGHRVILSLLSERFRGMFSSGFREATQSQIVIYDVRYEIFLQMMEYLYTGSIQYSNDDYIDNVEFLIELLCVSDQFMLDHLKQICELKLQHVVREDTVDVILQAAEQSNAIQLRAICLHYLRNL